MSLLVVILVINPVGKLGEKLIENIEIHSKYYFCKISCRKIIFYSLRLRL